MRVVKIVTLKEDNIQELTIKINEEVDKVDQGNHVVDVRDVRLSQTSAGHRTYYSTLVIYKKEWRLS